MKLKVAQLCLTFCNPMDYTVHGILQARILDWVAFPFSRESSQTRDRNQISCIADLFQMDIDCVHPIDKSILRREKSGWDEHAVVHTIPLTVMCFQHSEHLQTFF